LCKWQSGLGGLASPCLWTLSVVPVSVGLAPTKKDKPSLPGHHFCTYRAAYDKSLIPDYGINTQYSLLKGTTSRQMSTQVRLSVAKRPQVFRLLRSLASHSAAVLLSYQSRRATWTCQNKARAAQAQALCTCKGLSFLPHTPTPPTQTLAISNSPTPALDDSTYLRR